MLITESEALSDGENPVTLTRAYAHMARLANLIREGRFKVVFFSVHHGSNIRPGFNWLEHRNESRAVVFDPSSPCFGSKSVGLRVLRSKCAAMCCSRCGVYKLASELSFSR